MAKRRYSSTAVHFPNGNDLNQSITISYTIFSHGHPRLRVRVCVCVHPCGGFGGWLRHHLSPSLGMPAYSLRFIVRVRGVSGGGFGGWLRQHLSPSPVIPASFLHASER